MAFQNEKQVARQAERMLTDSLQAKTSGFADHVRRLPEDKSLKDAFAFSKVKRYGRGRGNVKEYMTTLSIRMVKHGFIQHYGVNIQRSSGSRTRKVPRETTYNFSAHYFKMDAKPFVNSAVTQSNAIPFVMENVTRLRSEEMIFEIRSLIERT